MVKKIRPLCPDCGVVVYGDAGYCRKHYYERKRNGEAPDEIRMIITDWEVMADGVRRRLIYNAATD